jgi:hypothetical protein
MKLSLEDFVSKYSFNFKGPQNKINVNDEIRVHLSMYLTFSF